VLLLGKVVSKRDYHTEFFMRTAVLEGGLNPLPDDVICDQGCILRRDIESRMWIAANPRFVPAASDVVSALVTSFNEYGSEILVSLQEDPDDGRVSLVFDILTPLEGPKARTKLDDFLEMQMPESARPLEDEMIFSVTSKVRRIP
jgi:hypothetical protein